MKLRWSRSPAFTSLRPFLERSAALMALSSGPAGLPPFVCLLDAAMPAMMTTRADAAAAMASLRFELPMEDFDPFRAVEL